jgi:hypothetical protein
MKVFNPKSLRSRLMSLKWNIVNSGPIALVSWSAIRRIGQSRLLSLTIVVPFLGWLLLFNQHVVEMLTLSPELVRRWMKLPNASDEIAHQLTLPRLYYVYFGLTFLGVGSGLFARFCPQIVKNYASAIECVQAESSLVTGSRIYLIVSEVSLRYLDWLASEDGEMPSLMTRLGHPIEFTDLCSVSLVEVFSDLSPELFAKEPVQADQQTAEPAPAIISDATSAYEDDPFYDRRGRPDPYMIAKALTSGRRSLQWFVHAFAKQARSDAHKNDMLALHYMALDNTRPRLRIIVAAFYGIGFTLLIIPSILTFAQITWHVALH